MSATPPGLVARRPGLARRRCCYRELAGLLLRDQALDDDVVARAAVEDVEAAAADQHVVAGAADEDVVAGAADQDVVAVAAIGRSAAMPRIRPDASITSSPPRPLMTMPVVAPRSR